jgi:flagellar biogenesis protein FliO
MIHVIAAFCVVLGLMLASLYGLRYFQQKQWFSKLGLHPKKLEVLESLALDQKRRIVWIRHESEAYLVLLGASQDVVLNGPVPYEPTNVANKDTFNDQNLIEVSA